MPVPRFSSWIALAALGSLALPALSGATLYMAAVDGPGASGFEGQLNRNQTTASYSFSSTGGIPQSVAANWNGAVNLLTGELHQFTHASNSGLDPTISHVDGATIDFVADTITFP